MESAIVVYWVYRVNVVTGRRNLWRGPYTDKAKAQASARQLGYTWRGKGYRFESEAMGAGDVAGSIDNA